MNFEKVSIVSVRHVDAPHRVTSAEIQERLAETMERLGMRSDLLETVVGIHERRFWDEGFEPSDAATLAAQSVLDATDLDPAKLGTLINTSVCRDYVEPSTACLVHGNLKLPATCTNMDVGNACLAFFNGIEIVGNMIERGQIDYGLIVDGESARYLTEATIERLRQPSTDMKTFHEEFASLTTGSGAVAMLLAHSDLAPDGHRFKGTVSLAATEHNRLCLGQLDHGWTDTKSLLMAGIELSSRTWKKAQEELGFEEADVDQYCLHQVSLVHAHQLASSLGVNIEKALLIVSEYGNIGPASVPMVLSMALDRGRIVDGDRVVLAGIGSGINCMVAEVIW